MLFSFYSALLPCDCVCNNNTVIIIIIIIIIIIRIFWPGLCSFYHQCQNVNFAINLLICQNVTTLVVLNNMQFTFSKLTYLLYAANTAGNY